MPAGQRTFTRVADGRCEDGLVLDVQIDRFRVRVIDEGYRYGGFHRHFLGPWWEQKQCSEHVFVSL